MSALDHMSSLQHEQPRQTMCYVCCKELKGWCKSFTRIEGLLSILEASLLVIFLSFFIFLILHFVACRTYPEAFTEEPPNVTPEKTTSTTAVVTTVVTTVVVTPAPSTATDSSSTSGSTSTLPPDVECTWEPSQQTSAATHYYLDIGTRSSGRNTRTLSTSFTEDELTTEETLEIFNSTLETARDYDDDDEFVESADGDPADDTYKGQVAALVKLKPLGDVTFGCILTKITKFWTLTAASCIESIEDVDSLDSFVIIEQFGEAAASRARGVADVRVHPHFRAAGRSRAHDLAALRAHRALRAAALPRLPALLDYFLVAIGERFHILGYGGFRSGGARRLRQVAVFWLGGGACGAAGARHLARAGAGAHGACGAGAACAGPRWARGQACGYCAGTPLLRAGTLFGVMSDGGACGLSCEPQLFVNIATLRDWIDAVTID